MILDLGNLGIQWKGEFQCKKIGRKLEPFIPITQKIPDSNIWIENEKRKLEFIREIDKGSYGKICLCKRWTVSRGEHFVFTKIQKKINKDTNDSFIKEAIIQKEVAKCLREHGFEKGSPDVLDLFKLYDGTICFSMEMFYGSQRMDNYIKNFDKSDITLFSGFIIELIVQVVSMLDILQKKLGLNHRDLNTSNILIQKLDTRKVICLDKDIRISTNYSISIIDFGISCMGCNIQLGKVYPANDICPKPGRDIFLFLALFFCEFSKFILGPIRQYFKKWIERDYGKFCGKKIWKFLNHVEKGDYWIYWLSSQADIKEFPFTSMGIIKDLQQLA